MIKRYDIEGDCGNDYCPVQMQLREKGDWVDYDDYTRLRTATKNLIEAIKWKNEVGVFLREFLDIGEEVLYSPFSYELIAINFNAKLEYMKSFSKVEKLIGDK